MSSQKNLEYKKSSFLHKTNSAFIEQMYIKFVKPTKDYADLIIPYGGKNKTSIDTIVTNIKKNYI